MNIKVISPEFEIHTTPLEEIFINNASITITLDDINEERYRLFVQPYQAINIVDIDCVSSRDYYNEFCYRDGKYHRHILQIENSDKINALTPKMHTKELKHFVLPLQDILIEFIAYDFELDKI